LEIAKLNGPLVFVVVKEKDAPEGEVISIDIAEAVAFLVLDVILEVVNSPRRRNLDRKRGRFTINDAIQA